MIAALYVEADGAYTGLPHVDAWDIGRDARRYAGKGTWLYANKIALPELRWGACEQRLHPTALAKYGYEKARRIGMMAMVGGKDKTKIRNSTPDEFRDLLLSMVRVSDTSQVQNTGE